LNYVNPDIAWYTELSTRKNLSPRCPFASVYRCPRYYQSLSLLGEAGSTKIDPIEDAKLLTKWKASDLWPATLEQATSVLGTDGSPDQFMNYCPEVMFDRFGLFASGLSGYADELDRDLARSKLGKEHATADDWRWRWSFVSPLHYTECALYSPLLHDSSKVTSGQKPNQTQQKTEKTDGKTVLYFVVGLVLTLVIWGLQLIGVTVNLLLGGIVLLIAFVLMAYSFWIWEGTSSWRKPLRISTVFVAALLYFGLVGRQIVKQWHIDHAPQAKASVPNVPQTPIRTGLTGGLPSASPPSNKPLPPFPAKPKPSALPPSVSATGKSSAAVGSVTQGPYSIAQIGGTGNTAVINPAWNLSLGARRR
jgi:hypothetical protein